ncbi:hypothetical protein BJV82DRAFT_668932 [Fennellomyces sp. T-0311]|nr:hypothetical protein BJV82DRAFT_668932 [Fennellomyces sp. T-0311]
MKSMECQPAAADATSPQAIYFSVYASDLPLLSWLQVNDVRNGSHLLVQGRFSMKKYLHKRGHMATAYSITAEKFALAVTGEFTVRNPVAGEHAGDPNATMASMRSLLSARRLLRQEITEQFVEDVRGLSDPDQQSQAFLSQVARISGDCRLLFGDSVGSSVDPERLVRCAVNAVVVDNCR